MADIIITLTTVGADQGPLFDLYSDVDGYSSAFEVGVAQAALESGYTTALAPDGTSIVRVCGQGVKCSNCVDIPIIYTTTTTTTLTPVGCEETANSGGVGVTEYFIQLETDGGELVLDFDAYGVPDKLEILHNGIKVATSGMTVANSGPFDDIYGDPTVPTQPQTLTVDQFIGTQKAVPPTREAEIFADLGKTFISNGQQLIWFSYTATDYLDDPFAIVRITGPSGTAWQLTRLCDENTTTTTTTSTSSTTTTTTTAAPTTTTTTTLSGLIASTINDHPNTNLIQGCDILTANVNVNVWVDTQSGNNIPSIGDVIYQNPSGTAVYPGNGDYYKFELGGGSYYGARVSAAGVILAPISICA